MLEAQKRTIGEHTYEVTQLTAPIGRKLLVRLFKVLGPPIGAALAGLPEGDGDGVATGDLKTKAIGDAVMMLAETLTESELEHLVETLTPTTLYSLEADKWLQLKDDNEFHWAGRFLDMFAWIGFCLECNYSDFLGGQTSLAGIASAMSRGNLSPSPSQRTSTGTSTESPQASDTP